jgi:hypothetical protein
MNETEGREPQPSESGFTNYEAMRDEVVVRRPHGEVPYLKELDPSGRQREIKTHDQRGGATLPFQRIDREAVHSQTEENHLRRLKGFLDMVTAEASKDGSEEGRRAQADVRKLTEQLVYIGEPEFKQATEGLADHWKSLAESGYDVVVLSLKDRSERYVDINAFEALARLTEGRSDLRQKIKISDTYPADMAERIKAGDKVRYILADDFPISNGEMKIEISNLRKHFNDQVIEENKIGDFMEVNFLARMPEKGQSNDTFVAMLADRDLPVDCYSYYEVPESPGGYPSITGSHSSSDYGYESFIGYLDKYLQDRGMERSVDLPQRIIRDYEHQGGVYDDPELEARWQKVKANWG